MSQIRQLSPFRYPGGKTWLVPSILKWVKSLHLSSPIFVEPFAGGAIAGLSVAAKGLAQNVMLGELDDDVAAVWRTILYGDETDIRWLSARILNFEIDAENVRTILDSRPRSERTKAFKTIVRNRVSHGGILAPGAGLIKKGENGRGLVSKWYPETLVRRIEAIRSVRGSIAFEKVDAFELIARYAKEPTACFFIDPPYTANKASAGKRLYLHNQVDHEALFEIVASAKGAAMLTYDDVPEVHSLAKKFRLKIAKTPMKSTHHRVVNEVLLYKAR